MIRQIKLADGSEIHVHRGQMRVITGEPDEATVDAVRKYVRDEENLVEVERLLPLRAWGSIGESGDPGYGAHASLGRMTDKKPKRKARRAVRTAAQGE